jgi:hypothetical protein
VNLLRTFSYRVYQDFLMGSRLDEYRRLLRHLRELGYRFSTMSEFALNSGKFDSPVCLLRNDIDSDPAGAAQMFACDSDERVRATYYFRLATVDTALIRRIVAQGGEVGYHFEEIADFSKQHGLKSRGQIDEHMDAIRNHFRHNIRRFIARTGVMPRTVASHGDFINRRLGVPNSHLLTRELMRELGIVADAYDPALHAGLSARFSDRPAPQWWHPANPLEALDRKPSTISILVHPRQWLCHPGANLRLGVLRIRDEAVWRRRTTLRNRNNQSPVREAAA